MTSSRRGTVHVQFHHALVVDPDDRFADPDADTIPEWPMAPLPGGVGARVYTGIHTGTIVYTWAIHAEQPPADEPWPEEAQAVIGVPLGRLVVDDMSGANLDAPVIEAGPPGSWVLRVRYLDRHAEWDAAPEGEVAVERRSTWTCGRRRRRTREASCAPVALDAVRARPRQPSSVISAYSSRRSSHLTISVPPNIAAGWQVPVS